MKGFFGYHSEWNLGSPGGWDYQRVTQIIGKAVWERSNQIRPIRVDLDFDHPLLHPIGGFAEEVTDNRNLADRLDAVDGLDGVLAAPQELESSQGRVCWQGRPVSIIFMDFKVCFIHEI